MPLFVAFGHYQLDLIYNNTDGYMFSCALTRNHIRWRVFTPDISIRPICPPADEFDADKDLGRY